MNKFTVFVTVFRIRMDPGFYADPEQDFKSPVHL